MNHDEVPALLFSKHHTVYFLFNTLTMKDGHYVQMSALIFELDTFINLPLKMLLNYVNLHLVGMMKLKVCL